MLAVAGTTALAICAGAGGAQAASRLVFADFSAGTDDIFTVRSDGSHRHQVTDGRAFKANPAWSPNRRRIVFSRVNDGPARLVVMRANGTHAHVIPHVKFAVDPSWAPNGRRIAYSVGNSHGKYAIFTARLDGTHRRRLTAFRQNVDPDWSPSGKSIVYAARDGILRMRANGHHKQVVSSSGFAPSWSPKGGLIAFVDDAANPEAVTDVYTIRVNGTHRRNLTGTRPAAPCPDEPDECRRESEFPAFSPGGKRVAFDETSSGNGDAGIFTVKLDGSGVRQLTHSGHAADW
jgi:Tol biopolymer transport system component